MTRSTTHSAGKPASFADFLTLWEDLREDEAPQAETKPSRLADAVATLGLGWLGNAMLSGAPRQK